MMTIWWANNLKSKDDLHLGQVLRIPPVNGPRRHGHRDRHPRQRSPTTLRGRTPRTSSSTNELDGPEPRHRPGARRAGRQGQADPDAQAGHQAVERASPAVVAAAGSVRPAPDTYTGGALRLARRRWRQLHQPVLPLRPLRPRHRRPTTARAVRAAAAGTVIFAGWKSNGGGYQVWIAHGSGPVHDLQPHVGGLGRARPAVSARPAGRPGRANPATRPARTSTSRSGAAADLERRPRASTRSPTSRRHSPPSPALTSRPCGAARAAGREPCENDRDVPRPREDLGPRRRRRRRGRDLPAGGARPARRPRRRRRRARRLGLPAGRRRPDDAARLQPPPPLQGDARRSRHAGPPPRQGRRRPHPRRPARDRGLRRRDRRAAGRSRRRRPERDGRARRSRRPRQHALQDVDPPGAQARPEGRARRGALAAPRAPADRRHRPRRAAERRQVDAPRGGHRGARPRSPTTRSRRSSRTSA